MLNKYKIQFCNILKKDEQFVNPLCPLYKIYGSSIWMIIFLLVKNLKTIIEQWQCLQSGVLNVMGLNDCLKQFIKNIKK